jgi:hypothetical protein
MHILTDRWRYGLELDFPFDTYRSIVEDVGRARVSGALRRRALDPTAGRASGRPKPGWSAAEIRALLGWTGPAGCRCFSRE